MKKIAESLEGKIDPGTILNARYAKQNFLMERENLRHRMDKEKRADGKGRGP